MTHHIRLIVSAIEIDGVHEPVNCELRAQVHSLPNELEHGRKVANLELRLREQTEHRMRAETEVEVLRQLYRPWWRRVIGR